MNKSQNSSRTQAKDSKNDKSLFRLLKKIFAAKEVLLFDFYAVNHEKLPIIYANIRV